MRNRTVAAILVGTVSGALSVFVCGFMAFVGLMYIGERYCQDYEYYLCLWWVPALIGGLAGFYFPLRWVLGCGGQSGD